MNQDWQYRVVTGLIQSHSVSVDSVSFQTELWTLNSIGINLRIKLLPYQRLILLRKQAFITYIYTPNHCSFSLLYNLSAYTRTITRTHFIMWQMKEVTAGLKWQQSEWSQHAHRGDKSIDWCSYSMCTGTCGSSQSLSPPLLPKQSVASVFLLDSIHISI